MKLGALLVLVEVLVPCADVVEVEVEEADEVDEVEVVWLEVEAVVEEVSPEVVEELATTKNSKQLIPRKKRKTYH